MTAVARHHAGQQRPRHVDQAGDVGRDHLVPLGEVAFLRRQQPEREAGIVDEHVDVPPPIRQAAGQCRDGGGVGHVELQRQDGVAEGGFQFVQPVAAAPGRDHAVAVVDETFGDGAAEAGGRAGDEGGEAHGVDCRIVRGADPAYARPERVAAFLGSPAHLSRGIRQKGPGTAAGASGRGGSASAFRWWASSPPLRGTMRATATGTPRASPWGLPARCLAPVASHRRCRCFRPWSPAPSSRTDRSATTAAAGPP